jgi:hypothetical protein
VAKQKWSPEVARHPPVIIGVARVVTGLCSLMKFIGLESSRIAQLANSGRISLLYCPFPISDR